MEIQTVNLVIGFIFLLGMFLGAMTGSVRVFILAIVVPTCLYFVFGAESLQDKIIYFGFCLSGLIVCFAAIAKYWLNTIERE